MEPLLSITDLFKKSFDVYKQNIKIILTMAGIGYAPVLLMAAVDFLFFEQIDWHFFWAALLFFIPLSLVIFAVNFLVYISFFYIIKNQGGDLSVKNLFSLAWKNAISFGWVMLLEGLCVMLGLILFVIPGIIVAIWLIFSNQVLAFESLKGKAALVRSRELVRGYWWPVFFRYFLLMIFSSIISMIPVLGDAINFLFVIPFCVIFGYTLYQDLKRIKVAV